MGMDTRGGTPPQTSQNSTRPSARMGDAEAIVEAVERLGVVNEITLDDEADLIVIRDAQGAQQIVDTLPYRKARLDAPERRTGTAKLTDLGSFIAHVRRFADEDSAVFAIDDRANPRLVGVLDYHRQGATAAARFGQHRAEYAFPLSDEWKAWTGRIARSFTQSELAQWLEDRILDLLDPSQVGESNRTLAERLGIKLAGPATLTALARDFAVRADVRVAQAVVLSTGETSVSYDETHETQSKKTGGKLEVPGGFVIAIPVFRNGAAYQMLARLRYRLQGGVISWWIAIEGVDRVFDHAISEAIEHVHESTQLPVYRGTPEA
jgi:uncharacterized protein YfdQ (DUF2303 family)